MTRKSVKYDRKNKTAKFHRGYCFKARSGKNVGKWVTPDGKRRVSDKLANAHNATRRGVLTRSDAWAWIKTRDLALAKSIGWRNFQKATKGLKGDRKAIAGKIRELVKREYDHMDVGVPTRRYSGQDYDDDISEDFGNLRMIDLDDIEGFLNDLDDFITGVQGWGDSGARAH